MKRYVIYNKSTGKILSAIQTSGNPENDTPEGYDYLETNENTNDKKIDINTKDIIDSTDEKPHILTEQAKIKKHRNFLLQESDWTQVPDSPLSDSKKAEWATYRQELRDMMTSVTNETEIGSVVWPTPPE